MSIKNEVDYQLTVISQPPVKNNLARVDSLWWAEELKERDFFKNLSDVDLAVMLSSVVASSSSVDSVVTLQTKIKCEVTDFLEGSF